MFVFLFLSFSACRFFNWFFGYLELKKNLKNYWMNNSWIRKNEKFKKLKICEFENPSELNNWLNENEQVEICVGK